MESNSSRASTNRRFRGEDYDSTAAISGAVERWSYDANGATAAATNPLGQTVAYAYDDAGRNTLVDYPSGTDASFAYDDANRRTAMADATGATAWTYDAASQLASLSQPQGTLTYGYDLAGARTAQSGAGQSQSWSYDPANGRLLSQTNGFGETTSYLYDALGRVARKTFGSGAYEAYAYDARGRVAAISLKNAASAVLRDQSYAYDASSKITAHTVAGVATAYAYDAAGQLVAESRPGYAGAYAYDANGNRLSRTVNGVAETYVYDDGDKLLSVSSGGVALKTYGYDAAGRTTSVASSAGTTALAYDYEGRAVSISGPGVSQTNAYNGLDARVGSTAGGVFRAYLRDGASPTDPLLKDGAATYTPGESVRSGGATSFLSAGLKSVDAQSSSSQTLSATRVYDAFGNVASSSGSWSGVFGYGGVYGYQEDATGLKLLGHRLYDPSTGRFLTRDPIEDGRNWYAYVENDPVNAADPEGLKVVIVGSPEEQDRIRRSIHLIGATGPTRQLVFDLINRKEIHVIRPLPSGSSPVGANSDGKVISVVPGQGVTLPGHGKEGKPLYFSSDTILAHEIGHQKCDLHTGRPSDPPEGKPGGPGDNVGDVENPYRRARGYPERARY